jgi:hypothetical protein
VYTIRIRIRTYIRCTCTCMCVYVYVYVCVGDSLARSSTAFHGSRSRPARIVLLLLLLLLGVFISPRVLFSRTACVTLHTLSKLVVAMRSLCSTSGRDGGILRRRVLHRKPRRSWGVSGEATELEGLRY